jgi:hypothetical protein
MFESIHIHEINALLHPSLRMDRQQTRLLPGRLAFYTMTLLPQRSKLFRFSRSSAE